MGKRIDSIKKKYSNDSYSHKGWLNSDHFIKRCLAVLGYYFVGGITIYAIFLLIVFIIMIIFLILGGIFSLFF